KSCRISAGANVPRYPPAAADASVEYFLASSSKDSPFWMRARRSRAWASVFTTIIRRPKSCAREVTTKGTKAEHKRHKKIEALLCLLWLPSVPFVYFPRSTGLEGIPQRELHDSGIAGGCNLSERVGIEI